MYMEAVLRTTLRHCSHVLFDMFPTPADKQGVVCEEHVFEMLLRNCCFSFSAEHPLGIRHQYSH
jgi:hypothetical protein